MNSNWLPIASIVISTITTLSAPVIGVWFALRMNQDREKPDAKLPKVRNHWKLLSACAFLFAEGIAILLLSGKSRYPINFITLLEVGIGFVGIVFAVVIPLLLLLMKSIEEHQGVTKGLIEAAKEQLEVIEILASEIDKKANSRRKQ